MGTRQGDSSGGDESMLPLVNLVRNKPRATSMYALETALRVAEVEGVAGVLVIRIPAKLDQPTEMSFTTGRVDVVLPQ